MPTARLNREAYLLELLSCARKLRDRKPSLFYAFEIFAHTGVCHFRTFDLVPARLSVLSTGVFRLAACLLGCGA